MTEPDLSKAGQPGQQGVAPADVAGRKASAACLYAVAFGCSGIMLAMPAAGSDLGCRLLASEDRRMTAGEVVKACRSTPEDVPDHG